jgi:predicted enzyme related to lactoylglutathione lyase
MQAAAASNLANVLASTGDLERARRFYEEVLVLSHEIGDKDLEGIKSRKFIGPDEAL